MSGLTCQHGSLRRSCEICERDERIADLERELADVTHSAAHVLERCLAAEQARDVLATYLRHRIVFFPESLHAEECLAALTKAGVEK